MSVEQWQQARQLFQDVYQHDAIGPLWIFRYPPTGEANALHGEQQAFRAWSASVDAVTNTTQGMSLVFEAGYSDGNLARLYRYTTYREQRQRPASLQAFAGAARYAGSLLGIAQQEQANVRLADHGPVNAWIGYLLTHSDPSFITSRDGIESVRDITLASIQAIDVILSQVESTAAAGGGESNLGGIAENPAQQLADEVELLEKVLAIYNSLHTATPKDDDRAMRAIELLKIKSEQLTTRDLSEARKVIKCAKAAPLQVRKAVTVVVDGIDRAASDTLRLYRHVEGNGFNYADCPMQLYKQLGEIWADPCQRYRPMLIDALDKLAAAVELEVASETRFTMTFTDAAKYLADKKGHDPESGAGKQYGKGLVTRGKREGVIKDNGLSGRECRLDPDTVAAWFVVLQDRDLAREDL